MAMFKRNLAVVIGINDYRHGVNPLKTAVPDAEQVADTLQKVHGYTLLHPRLRTPAAILDGDATLAKLRHLFDQTLLKQVQPSEQDRLLIYFAGHGVTRQTDDYGPQGYLVPQDGEITQPETLYSMAALYQALNRLKCRHLLLVLDCCFAGMFRWGTRKATPMPETIHWEHYHRFTRHKSWQVMTSAAHDQEALDYLDNRGTGKSSQHSPFAEAFFEGLQHGDLIPDGVITTPELYLYIERYLWERTRGKQTPGIWPLSKENRGEYIFQLQPDDQLKLKHAPKLEKDNNPYRGLEPFEERHARYFFGRQEVIGDLMHHITQAEQPLTVVTGISGSGKSSLVKAGLIPQVKAQHRHSHHLLALIKPGSDPYLALTQAVCPANMGISQLQRISHELQRSPHLFQLFIAKYSEQHPQKTLLLVIDQFEEFITLAPKQPEPEPTPPPVWFDGWRAKLQRQSTQSVEAGETTTHKQSSQWQAVIEMLTNTLQACPQLHLVVTLRSDFEPRFQESALQPLWTKARFVVRPMRSDELRDAVIGPANEMALYFEPPNLVDRLVDEVAQSPGALPLLSFTLSELYLKLHRAWQMEGKDNRALTIDDEFDAQGGVAGLLAQRADAEYRNLPDDAHRATLRRVMLRLVELEGAEAVKRRVPETELAYPSAEENDRVAEVLSRLDDARLIVGGNEAGAAYVELAHDFLVSGWDTLQNWIQEDQETLALQRLVTPAVKNWQKTQKDLWHGNSRLDTLQKIKNSEQSWFNDAETNFVQDSLELKTRNSQIRRTSVSTVIVVLSGITTLAVLSANRANRNLEEARYQNVVSLTRASEALLQEGEEFEGLVAAMKAQSVFKGLPDKAKQELLGPLLATFNQAFSTNTVWKDYYSFHDHINSVETLAFNSDGNILATGSRDGTAKLWNASNGSLITTLEGHSNPVSTLAFNPDGNILATGSSDILGTGNEESTVKLWRVSDGSLITTLEGHIDSIGTLAFHPEGDILATGSWDGTAKLWRVSDGSLITTLEGHTDGIETLAFHPEGDILATGSWDGKAKLSRVTQGNIHKTLEKQVENFRFSRRGRLSSHV